MSSVRRYEMGKLVSERKLQLETTAHLRAAPGREPAIAEEVDRIWHALKRRGWHPGRTDDTLSACVQAVIDAAPIGPYPRGRAGELLDPAAPAEEGNRMSEITLDEQIRCVRREIRMRENVYPRWIGQERMTQETADRELNTMRAVLATLERAANPPSPFAAASAGVDLASLRGEHAVLVSLLRETVDPLEVSAEVIDGDDAAPMSALLERIRKALAAIDARGRGDG